MFGLKNWEWVRTEDGNTRYGHSGHYGHCWQLNVQLLNCGSLNFDPKPKNLWLSLIDVFPGTTQLFLYSQQMEIS